MRIFTEVVTAIVMITTQVTTQVHLPVTAQLTAHAEAAGTSSHVIAVNTASTQPLKVISTKVSFDDAVGKPLKASQTAKAQAEATKRTLAATAQLIAKRTPVVIGGTDAFAQLRFCEAGGDYTKNTGNGFYGAYQYNLGTWANYGGFARPDLAPPAVQDAKAAATQAARGWNPWPACARKLGLM